MGQSFGSDSPQSQSYPGKGKMGPDGNKEKSSKVSDVIQDGDKNHMLTGMTASPQQAGQSASQASGGSNKFAVAGGNNKDVPSQCAGPQKPGGSAHDPAGDGGKFAQGGKTKMFGPQTSQPAKPR